MNIKDCECGCEARVKYDGGYYVRCIYFGCDKNSIKFDDEEKAIEAWNDGNAFKMCK